jgi:hypothetical protein
MRNGIIGVIVGLILGLVIGVLLFYWPGPLKVQYTGGYTYGLYPEEKAKYITLVADSYALDHDLARAQWFLSGWYREEEQQAISDAIAVAQSQGNEIEVQRLTDLWLALGLGAPAAPTAPTPVPQPTPSRPAGFMNRVGQGCIVFLVVFGGLALLFLLVRWLMSRRQATTPPVEEPANTSAPADLDATATVVPPAATAAPLVPQLGRWFTTYNLGDDAYDESFTIESASKEFLGECGVSISETIGKGEPDKVTAFEVWLFDKSDIRTVTRVLMSDHAFHDQALHAKLSAKGDPVLATVGVPFMLETSGLQARVVVTELEYGEDALPPKSFFQHLSVELVARVRPQ